MPKRDTQPPGVRLVFKKTKLSIVTPVLDSPAIVSRHVLHYKKMNLPDDVEIIFIDDGSKIPLKDCVNTRGLRNFYIYPTGDKRPWTISLARNMGIKLAQGEYILNTDIDHVFNQAAIEAAYNFTGDKMFFNRQIGILDNHGRLTQDLKTLYKYGFTERYYKKHRFKKYVHVGTHCIRRDIVVMLDGYPPKSSETGVYPTREDVIFYNRYRKLKEKGIVKPEVYAPLPAMVYMFPVEDKLGYFHKLKRL
jgi:glycosyltransferase involved in cell wall biosynthesis